MLPGCPPATAALWLGWAKVSVLKIKSPSKRRIEQTWLRFCRQERGEATSPDLYPNPSWTAGRSRSSRRPSQPLGPHLVPSAEAFSPSRWAVESRGTNTQSRRHQDSESPHVSTQLGTSRADLGHFPGGLGTAPTGAPKRADRGGRPRFRTDTCHLPKDKTFVFATSNRKLLIYLYNLGHRYLCSLPPHLRT